MKRIIVFLLITLLTLFSLSAESFTITAYSVDIEAEKNGELHITENISVHFSEPSHGIYRDIQTRFDNPNGNAFDPVRAKVRNIKAENLHETENSGNGIRLKLGNPDRMAEENETYRIEYDYALDYNRSEGYDELYYNIISPAWDTTIESIEWSIKMPSPVDRNRIWVREGKEGGDRQASFSLSSDRTRISGSKEFLLPLDALTVRVEMDKGYWKGWNGKEDNSFPYTISALIVSLLLLLASFLSWRRWGKDEEIGEIKERPLPPSRFSPLEDGYILDEEISAENEGLATVFLWAEKNIVSVKEEGEDNYRFTRKGNLPENSTEGEKKLFSLFFFKDSVTMKDLAEKEFPWKFMTDVSKAVREETKNLKSKESRKAETVFLILTLIMSIAAPILLSQKHPGLLSLLMALIYVFSFIFTAIIVWYMALLDKTMKKSTRVTLVVLFSLVVVASLILLTVLSVEAKLSLFTKLCVYLSYTFILLSSLLSSLMEKRSEEGTEIMREILGYRLHLVSLLEGKEPDEMDRKMWGVHMAYALAFKLKNEKNLNQFSDFPQPSWYTGNSWNGTMMMYYILFTSCRTSYTQTISSISTSPSSSGLGSGGFSGGGFSGGGGGSW